MSTTLGHVIALTWTLLLCLAPVTGHTSHVGCFEIVPKTIKSTVINPLTWQVCIKLCNEKDTMYAGIQVSTSQCFCGTNIPDHAEKVPAFECDEDCFDDSTKRCGGLKYISVYRLKDTSSFTFIVATVDSISYLLDSDRVSKIVTFPSKRDLIFDYHYAQSHLYFMSGTNIFRSMYVAELKQRFPPVVIVEMDYRGTALAVDWVHDKLYWCVRTDGATKYVVRQASIDGTDQEDFIKEGDAIFGMSLDPYERVMFFIRNNSVRRVDLTTRTELSDTLQLYHFEVVNYVAVDVHNQRVYMVGQYSAGGGPNYLVSTNYKLQMFRVLLHGSDLENCFTLSALGGNVFWNTRSSLMQWSEESPEAKTIATLVPNAKSARIYHEHAQSTGKKDFCSQKNCPNECQYSLEKAAYCVCPANTRLSHDKRTCIDLSHCSEDVSFSNKNDMQVIITKIIERATQKYKS